MNRPSKFRHALEMALGGALLREKKLQAENLRLNTIIDNRAEDLEVKAKYDKLQAKVERLEEALKDIAAHCCPKIYSPTCPEIAEQALKANKDGKEER